MHVWVFSCPLIQLDVLILGSLPPQEQARTGLLEDKTHVAQTEAITDQRAPSQPSADEEA